MRNPDALTMLLVFGLLLVAAAQAVIVFVMIWSR